MPSVTSEGNVPLLSPRVRILPELPGVGGVGGKANGLGRERRGGVILGVCTVDILARHWVLRVMRVGGCAAWR